jgi:hypothetical protein
LSVVCSYFVKVVCISLHTFTVDVVKWVDFQNSLESFFMFCWAVVTSISRELNEVYNLTDGEVYFHTIRMKLKQARPKDEITAYLNKINTENWFNYLNKSRNRVEHGQVPMYEFRYEGKVLLMINLLNISIWLHITTVNLFHYAYIYSIKRVKW